MDFPVCRTAAVGVAIMALCAALSPSTADAALQIRTVRWTPSPSPGVTRYLLSVGTSAGSYMSELDLGLPVSSNGEMRVTVSLDDSVDLYIALRAANSSQQSALSNEIVIPRTPVTPPNPTPTPPGPGGGNPNPPPGQPPVTGPVAVDRTIVGLSGDSSGVISVVYSDATTLSLIGHPNPAVQDLRPAWCDLDGDGTQDLVIGFGRGGRGEVLLLVLGDFGVESSMTTVITGYWSKNSLNQMVRYEVENGETWPACGDVDGDGLNEVVVGLGSGSSYKVHILDDSTKFFAPMWPAGSFLDVAFGGIRQSNGSAIPAVGDIDGDGKAEIVIGRSAGGDGSLAVFDDAGAGFRPLRSNADVSSGTSVLFALGVADPTTTDGAVYPAVADIDGDGVAEIVAGLGAGGGGKVFAFDDSLRFYRRMALGQGGVMALETGWAAYRANNGSAIPFLADIDRDGRIELGVGFGTGGEGRIQLFDDAGLQFLPYPAGSSSNGIIDTLLNRRVVPALRRR